MVEFHAAGCQVPPLPIRTSTESVPAASSASVASTCTVTIPVTEAPSAGLVIVAVGGSSVVEPLSIIAVTGVASVTLPSLSVPRASTTTSPSAWTVVSQVHR